MPRVVILMGSASDEAKVAPCVEVLRKLEIDFFITVCSAHRTPDRTAKVVREQEQAGCKVFICAAGMAAHLAGAVAARTTKPVLGVPLAGSSLAGFDALLSTVQMPPAYPVATLALDGAGAKNAAWLAAEILALTDQAIAERLVLARQQLTVDITEQGEAMAKKYA
ncbi:MAG: 5-(carboxyamino)imidazole ribonucleotide mutase [Desulfovibrio sp.]|nr:5-(carboxyamino)imidazole ribonucleotide mutase [Desulfovibrio sp.]